MISCNFYWIYYGFLLGVCEKLELTSKIKQVCAQSVNKNKCGK
jgi:hypothetical protein